MSDFNQRQIASNQRRIGQTEVGERPAGFNIGTSFPSSPATNDRFFRTDLGWLCYYDGTRWLTVHEYQADLTWYQRITLPYTGATPATLLLTPLRTDRNYYYTRGKIYMEVATTNNGTNYWTCALVLNLTTVWTLNTSADAANTGLNKEDSTAAVVTTGGFARFDVTAKTGAPGAVTVHCAFWYRPIVT